MEVIHCGKTQLARQNLPFSLKLPREFNLSKSARSVQKFGFLCNILYKSGKRGVIRCGLKEKGGHWV